MWKTKLLLLSLVGVVTALEGSLQSAMDAVERRQRDLHQLRQYQEFLNEEGLPGRFYAPDDGNDLAFLQPEYGDDVPSDMVLVNQDDGFKKQLSSAFRERAEQLTEKQRDQLAEALLRQLGFNPNANDDNEQYLYVIRQLYQKYHDNDDYNMRPKVYANGGVNKRVYPFELYTNLGYNSVGMQKKSLYEPDGPNDALYMLNYIPGEKLNDHRLDVIESEADNRYLQNVPNQERGVRSRHRPYYNNERFIVAKRSSNSLGYGNKELQHYNRLQVNRVVRNPPATDPEVAKELSNVFGIVKTSPEDKPKKSIGMPTKPESTERNVSQEIYTYPKEKKSEKRTGTKQVGLKVSKEELLNVKKKSIDWSDYFGYDRKKKSNNLDNEFLMERYHKAVAVGNKKSSDYPLQVFRNYTAQVDSEQEKLKAMDAKLKTAEESIVDETLKYTGAHEGTSDLQEIQDVKDEIISRLAAAYSLEKMRKALGEYKHNIDVERQKLKELKKIKEKSIAEVKRLSVPRKQAVDEERQNIQDGDNSIKCSNDGEDCDEQTYKSPSGILEEEAGFTRGDCPKIQRVCNEVASVLGTCGSILEPACIMHQVCLVCGENSWVVPTQKCNLLFLAKSADLCDGDKECEKIARNSVTYLMEIKSILRAEAFDECDLMCPDNGA